MAKCECVAEDGAMLCAAYPDPCTCDCHRIALESLMRKPIGPPVETFDWAHDEIEPKEKG